MPRGDLVLHWTEAAMDGGVVRIGANFPGAPEFQSGYIPPDSDGAVRAGYFVEFLNGVYNVYTLAGDRVQTMSQDEFWAAAGSMEAGFKYDPRIVFDPDSGRWLAAMLVPTGFLLAVS